MNVTLKEVIISHINYRDVFNAPLHIDYLLLWTGANENIRLKEEVYNVLADLESENLIIRKNGYLAIYEKYYIIDAQDEKDKITKQLIDDSKSTLNLITKIPFIRYLGISGSVAANNPTANNEDPIDLDLFVITSKNTLWLIFLIERLITNVIRLFKGDHFYCFNFVTEEDFLIIQNKNFYTATELINLKTVFDTGIYDHFINSNEWYTDYYSKESIKLVNKEYVKSSDYFKIFIPFNYLFYMVFSFLRGIKKFDLKIALEFTSKFDPNQKCNLSRISNPGGGYEDSIRRRFQELFLENFEKYYSVKLIDSLFVNKKSYKANENVDNGQNEFSKFFIKYSMNENKKSTV